VLAQRLVAASQVDPGVGIEVAECRRQAVTAVLQRCPAKRPQGVLKALGEGDIALALTLILFDPPVLT